MRYFMALEPRPRSAAARGRLGGGSSPTAWRGPAQRGKLPGPTQFRISTRQIPRNKKINAKQISTATCEQMIRAERLSNGCGGLSGRSPPGRAAESESVGPGLAHMFSVFGGMNHFLEAEDSLCVTLWRTVRCPGAPPGPTSQVSESQPAKFLEIKITRKASFDSNL